MDEGLQNLINNLSTDTVQIARAVQGLDPASVGSRGTIQSALDSPGVIILGVAAILALAWVLKTS
jgi:hypothetical protein